MMTHPHPCLKWPGGKRQLLPELLKRVPHFTGSYREPFVGGGALYFALRNERSFPAVLSDSNARLIRTYSAIRINVDEVMLCLARHAAAYAKGGADYFYKVRDLDPDEMSDDGCAAWMIFLNKTCFNGLYRVNKQGKFNAPHGKWKSPPTILDEKNLRAVAAAFRYETRVEKRDFRAAFAEAVAGDFIYADPPYCPISTTANFTAYTKDGFGPQDQKDLRDLAIETAARGVHVMLSNAVTMDSYVLYSRAGFRLDKVKAKRSINSNGAKRGEVSEYIIRNELRCRRSSHRG